MQPRKKLWWGLSVLLILLILGLGSWWYMARSKSVDVVIVKPVTEPLMITRDVTLAPLYSATVSPAASGPILGPVPTVGTNVSVNDHLFTIDVSPYEAQLARARNATSEASAAPAAPPVNTPAITEAQQLLQQGIITQAEYAKIVAREQAKQPSVYTPSAAAAPDTSTIERQIAAANVTAPVAGKVTAVYVTADGVAVQDRPALVIASLSPLVGEMPLPNALTEAVQQARTAPETTLTLRVNGHDYFGEMTALSPTGGDVTALKFRFDNPGEMLQPATLYPLTLKLPTKVSLIHLPRRSNIGDDTVYIVTADGMIDARHVTTAYVDGDDWVVLEGLTAGERVIAEPAPHLEIGMHVDVRA